MRVRMTIQRAHERWRKSQSKLPRIYPSATEWSTIPSELRRALEGALHLDVIQGMSETSPPTLEI